MTAQGACSFFTAVRRFGRLFGDRPRAIEMRALFAALPAIATFFVMMISIKLVQSIVAVGRNISDISLIRIGRTVKFRCGKIRRCSRFRTSCRNFNLRGDVRFYVCNMCAVVFADKNERTGFSVFTPIKFGRSVIVAERAVFFLPCIGCTAKVTNRRFRSVCFTIGIMIGNIICKCMPVVDSYRILQTLVACPVKSNNNIYRAVCVQGIIRCL